MKEVTQLLRNAMRRGLPAFLFESGWFDATAAGCMKAYSMIPAENKHLLLGPWTHTGIQHVRLQKGDRRSRRSSFSHTMEICNFFAHYFNVSVPTWNKNVVQSFYRNPHGGPMTSGDFLLFVSRGYGIM